MRLNSFVSLAFAAAQSAVGLGINCHGDSLCGIVYMSGGSLSQFQSIFDNLIDKKLYENGDDVGCIEAEYANFRGRYNSTLCAYIQNAQGTVAGATLKSLYRELVEYGCAMCGSVPLFYAKGDDDVNHGELTIDMVDSLPEGCKVGAPCSTN
ncbi:hypothetical protein Trco_004707 [Trichoderma cornu-damae]|uniref:Killer toxin Kp4 domain-containing protein n=1 Tax=Trichoderma cornu-damae TaxID=654480 RepID=A0A9P8TUJ2_9HYPO|nr:hypothetical protein Trco_004707 [Trichoderma cornu-damae]